MTASQLATDLNEAVRLLHALGQEFVPDWFVSETGTTYVEMADCGHTCGVVGREVTTPFHAGFVPVAEGSFFATCADCGQEEIVVL